MLIQNGSLDSFSGTQGYRAVLGVVVGALGGLLLLSGLLGLSHKLIADATMAGTLAAQTAQRGASDVAAASPPASDQAATETADDSAAAATESATESEEPTPEPAGTEPAVSQETEPAADSAAVEPATAEPEVSEPVADSEPDADSSGDSEIHASAQEPSDPSDGTVASATSDAAAAGTDDAPATAADEDPLADADPATADDPVAGDVPVTDKDLLDTDDTSEPPSTDDTMAAATDGDAVETAQNEQLSNQQPAENVAGPESEAVDDTTAEPSPTDLAGESETVEPSLNPASSRTATCLLRTPPRNQNRARNHRSGLRRTPRSSTRRARNPLRLTTGERTNQHQPTTGKPNLKPTPNPLLSAHQMPPRRTSTTP